MEAGGGGAAPERTAGWWDAATAWRGVTFVAGTAQASTPEHAARRILEEILRRFEENGVATAKAVRLEVEPLPEEYRPEVAA